MSIPSKIGSNGLRKSWHWPPVITFLQKVIIFPALEPKIQFSPGQHLFYLYHPQKSLGLPPTNNCKASNCIQGIQIVCWIIIWPADAVSSKRSEKDLQCCGLCRTRRHCKDKNLKKKYSSIAMAPISNVRSQPIQLHWQVFLAKKKNEKVLTPVCRKVGIFKKWVCSKSLVVQYFCFFHCLWCQYSVLTADNIGSTDITGDGTGCYLTVYIYMGSSEVKYCTSDSTDVTGDTCSTGW